MPRHIMPVSLSSIVAFLLFAGFSRAIRAQEESPELTQAQAQYRKDVEFATRPIRDRYLSRLDSLKRLLGARGDARAAVAIQEEVDRVLASIPDESMATAASKLAGTWKITYSNGDSRTYGISSDGSASFLSLDPTGRVTGATKKKMLLKGGDVIVEFQEGTIERLKLSGSKLLVELYSPKASYPKGQPYAKGTGVPATVRKQ